MFVFRSGIPDLPFEGDSPDNYDDDELYFSCSEAEDDDANFDGYDSDTSDAGIYNGDSDDEFDLNFGESENENISFNFGETIQKFLVVWAVKFGISHTALDDLLRILKKFGHNELPNLARTLLHTPRKAVDPRPCGTGEFYYRGIRFNMLHYNQAFLTENHTVEMDFFIDGLSVSESSKVKMWPIMGSFVNQPFVRPFVVGCYSGKCDPVDVDDYLKEFVEEITLLQQNGVEVTKDKLIKKFRFRCFIADAPARAFASSTMGHASYFGCPKCNQVCCSEGHKMYYQFFVGELRTDESFRQRVDIQHHKPEFQERASLLEGIIGMVSQIVIEAMHAVDLGVTKRICTAIFGNTVSCSKLSKVALSALNARFKSFRSYVPSEFARKPRDLDESSGFKATEYRQMLLYTLPVLLKNIVSPQLYKQVLKLHVAIRLLSDPVRYKENLEAARKLICDFVDHYDDTVGKVHFTFYTHCLLHIADYVEEYGPLYSLSAYKYENNMRLIKRLLRRKHGHIKQFFNRVDEMRYADEIADELECSKNEIKFDEFNLVANSLRDGCCMLESGDPLVITGSFTRNGIEMICGKRFLKCQDFYDDPLPSMENMGIILASQLSETVQEFRTTEISGMERLVLNKWTKPKCADNVAFNPNNLIHNNIQRPVPKILQPKKKPAVPIKPIPSYQFAAPLPTSTKASCISYSPSSSLKKPLVVATQSTTPSTSFKQPSAAIAIKFDPSQKFTVPLSPTTVPRTNTITKFNGPLTTPSSSFKKSLSVVAKSEDYSQWTTPSKSAKQTSGIAKEFDPSHKFTVPMSPTTVPRTNTITKFNGPLTTPSSSFKKSLGVVTQSEGCFQSTTPSKSAKTPCAAIAIKPSHKFTVPLSRTKYHSVPKTNAVTNFEGPLTTSSSSFDKPLGVVAKSEDYSQWTTPSKSAKQTSAIATKFDPSHKFTVPLSPSIKTNSTSRQLVASSFSFKKSPVAVKKIEFGSDSQRSTTLHASFKQPSQASTNAKSGELPAAKPKCVLDPSTRVYVTEKQKSSLIIGSKHSDVTSNVSLQPQVHSTHEIKHVPIRMTLTKSQLLPLPSSWKSPPDERSRTSHGNDKFSSIKTDGQKGGVNVITSVSLLEIENETDDRNEKLLLLEPPVKLSSLNKQPNVFAENLATHENSISLNGRNDQTSSTIVGKKIVLPKEMAGRLVAFPYPFKDTSSIKSADNLCSSSIQFGSINSDEVNGHAINKTARVLHNPNTLPDRSVNGIKRKNDCSDNVEPHHKKQCNENNEQFVSREEFHILMKEHAKSKQMIKAMARKLREDNAEVESFSFPLEDEDVYAKFITCLKKQRFASKLAASLEKKISKSKDVVSDLVEAILAPKLLWKFNIYGLQNKWNFMKTPINEMFLTLSGMDQDTYYCKLTKVMNKMHQRHRRFLLHFN